MCIVTVFNKDKTVKKYFVPDSEVNVRAMIQQTTGDFRNVKVESVVKKDLSSLIALLYIQKREEKSQEIEKIERKTIFPAFEPSKW